MTGDRRQGERRDPTRDPGDRRLFDRIRQVWPDFTVGLQTPEERAQTIENLRARLAEKGVKS